MIEPSSEVDSTSRDLLRVLVESSAPVSGRRVAEALGISPTTAGKRLKALQDLGLVAPQPAGAAVLWSANDLNPAVRALRRDLETIMPAVGGGAPAPADNLLWARPSPGARPMLKAVVLTALGLEHAAVRSHLSSVMQRRTRSDTRYDVGLVRGAHLDWEVHLAEVDMGNAGAAAEVAGAIETFSPQLILFIGVAGGLKPKDQRHGDVVVASMVYNVHSAKLATGPDGGPWVLSRPIGIQAPHRLTQLVRAVGRTAWAVDPLHVGQPTGPAPASPIVHVRPIVAGEVVLANPDSDLRKLIAERFNDAAAIDMESYGVYETAHRYETPVLAVRGLSDLVGDKDPDADRERQPKAVANAAAFAIALLCQADEEDFPGGLPPGGLIGGGTPSHPPIPQGPHGASTEIPAAEDSLGRLAPGLRPWWRRMRARRGVVADTAVAELAERSPSAAGWISRLRHRPPAWLREDDQGDAWALVACFAESHTSPHTAWLYDEAADRANRIGEETIVGLHHFQAALATVRQLVSLWGKLEDGAPGDGGTVARTEALRRLSDPSLLRFGPIAAIFRGAVEENLEAILAAAPAALQATGIPPQQLLGADHLAGIPRPGSEEAGSASAVFEELVETDPDIVDQFRSGLLLMVGYALLAQSKDDSALTVFRKAREYAPGTAAPLIGMARARLHRVDGPIVDSNIEVSAELAEAQELAMLARDRRRSWHADSGEAVAIAVRARARSDPQGALRLVFSAPRGVATDAEARDPQVREAGAVTALLAGDNLLAADLAEGISDPVERDLLRAAALAEMPSTRDRAEEALRRALQAAPATRPDQLVRALAGLVQVGAPIQPGLPGTVAPELALLRSVDAEAADMVEATAALRAGQVHQALVITRQYPASIPAVEIAANAAVAAGDPKEAFRILERAGRARGDEILRTQALLLAADAGLDDEAKLVATQLALSRDAETKRRALEVQLELAGRASQWEEIVDLGQRLLEDSTFDLSDVRRDQHVVDYRWAVAGAEFNLRRPQRARKALDEPDALVPRNQSEALLLLAVMRAVTVPEPQVGEPGRAVLERVLAAAAAFPDVEEVVAGALKIAMTFSSTEPVPESQLMRVRALQEEFFNNFPDSRHLQRIEVGEDLGGLIEHLRATFAPGAEQLVSLGRQVWLGLYPQGLLADVTGRSYAELLIKRVAGCHVASTADQSLAEIEQATARAARETNLVVLDTSALVLLDHLSSLAQRLTAQFARVLLPASCRDDILASRNSLALRSTATLGWNPQQQRPQLTEFPAEVADRWAEAGARLAQRLASVEVVSEAKQGWSWDDSLQLARREQVALWADDLALRQAARSLGVPAFGTLDLVKELVDSDELPQSQLYEVLRAFRGAYVVDLPLTDQLSDFAAADGWKPDGYAALLVARPRYWAQPSNGFAEFIRLMRVMPSSDKTPESVVGWASAAMTGVAWATHPSSRPQAVAALVAWTVLNAADPEIIFPKVLDVGESIMAAAAPAGDLLAHTVSILTETLGQIVPADKVGVLFTRLVANFDETRRTQVMKSFLSIPR